MSERAGAGPTPDVAPGPPDERTGPPDGSAAIGRRPRWAMPADAGAAVDAVFAGYAEREHIPAIAWGVVASGAVVHAGALGRTEQTEAGVVVDIHTSFRIASMTKSFTAATVLALRDDGLLALDTPAAVYAPALAGLRPPTADTPPITVRLLLSMATGMANDDPWADRLLDADDPTMDALYAGGAHFAITPGSRFEYSNLGYAALGTVIRAVTGERPQSVITQRILRPLGLDATGWTAPGQPSGRPWARPHRVVDDTIVPDAPPLADGGFAPMGGLWSTVSDLASWVYFFCDAFPPRDEPDDRPLGRASRREMQQVWRDLALTLSTTPSGRQRLSASGYGAGLLIVSDLALGRMVGHSGGLPGYGSNMRWLPERGIGVIALANRTYAPMADATRDVLDLLDERDALPAPHRPVAASMADAAGRLASLLAAPWSDGVADSLFSTNVALDDPYDRRAAASAAVRAVTGPWQITKLTADDAVHGDAELTGDNGRVAELSFQLSPEVPPRIQWYELKLTEGTADQPAG